MALDGFMAFVPGDGDPFPIQGESTNMVVKGVNGFEIVDFKWGASASAQSGEVKKLKDKIKYHESQGEDVPDHLKEELSEAQRSSSSPGRLPDRSIKVDSFRITKPIDKASLALFRACTSENAVYAKAQVIFRKYGLDRKPFIYLLFEFQKVIVEKIDWSLGAIGESNDKPEEEDLVFSFSKCKINYTPQSSTGDKMMNVRKTVEYSKPLGKQDDAD